MTHGPTVSAVIPVHNGDAYIAEAIESVLEQSRPPIECLVVDDGSTDATAAVVRRFEESVTYICQPQSGVSVARNRGAELARGQLVAFLDHDDVWLPTKLERQIEALSDPHATMAVCGMQVIDRGGAVLTTKRLPTDRDLVTAMLSFGTEIVSCSSTGLVRRAAFLASGGFDRALSMSADWDLLLRTLLDDAVAYVDEPLVSYRVHDANMSRNVSVMEHDMTRAFAKAFADPRLPEVLREDRRHCYGRLYRMLAASYRDTGRWSSAVRTLTISLRYDPRVALNLLPRSGGVV